MIGASVAPGAADARYGGARLVDVARLAGVSLATASRALGAPERVRPDTRMRVERAANRLGYVPHGAARALASQRTRTVGAVFPPVENPIFALGTHALAQELAAAGYTLLLASHDYDEQAEFEAARRLLERGVDGLVLVGLRHSPALFSLLERSGVPYELTWSIDPSGRHHCSGISHREASAALVRHLLDLGHREFAVIAGLVDRNDRAHERMQGVQQALAAAGLGLPPARVVQAPFSIAAGRAAFAQLHAQTRGFTALVGGNDLLAVGALLECQQAGIDVPGEVSIVGFDDIELAGELRPGLTTVRMPSSGIGRAAAHRLLARLAGEHVAACNELRADLVVRQTTGPVPARRITRARP